MAKRSANCERKPMSILNLNPIAALYVVRDYVQGMESRRDFVERVDPDAVEPTPVADETVAADSAAQGTVTVQGTHKGRGAADGGAAVNIDLTALEALAKGRDAFTCKLPAAMQRQVFGTFLGKGQLHIDLVGRRIRHIVKVCFGTDWDYTDIVQWDAPQPLAADPQPVASPHRPILDSDVEAASRGLQIARKSVGQLESLIAHHGKPEMLFASHLIAEAARREIERRSPRPDPVLDVRSMSKLELRIIVQGAYDGWNGESLPAFTPSQLAASCELERRVLESESAFEARVEAWGGKSAFEYEARDPADGMTVHAYDLVCDQFFGLDDACGGDYAAAWERATSVLASCTRLDGNRYMVESTVQQLAALDPTPAESMPDFAASLVELSESLLSTFDTGQRFKASVALHVASGHMKKFGPDAWPDPTAALTRGAQQHCESTVAQWLAKERAYRRADRKADARAIAAHWQSIADTFGRLNTKALRGEPIQPVEPDSVAACAPPVVERQDESAADPCSIRTIGDFRRAIRRGAYAWPGGYPLYFVLADGEALSFESAKRERRQVLEAMAGKGWGDLWTPVAVAINWEDPDLVCVHSGERIESAYAD